MSVLKNNKASKKTKNVWDLNPWPHFLILLHKNVNLRSKLLLCMLYAEALVWDLDPKYLWNIYFMIELCPSLPNFLKISYFYLNFGENCKIFKDNGFLLLKPSALLMHIPKWNHFAIPGLISICLILLKLQLLEFVRIVLK